jgi:predicted nucleotidyltransferase component of viral defense system
VIEKRLEARIAEYGPQDSLHQELVLHEILQEIILASLAKAGFFSRAVFGGGTALRILHGTERFSEDLDFLLDVPDPGFRWEPLALRIRDDCRDQGIELEVQDRSRDVGAVKKAFLKTDSIGKLLVIALPHSRNPRQKIGIKLEIDTNPPSGSTSEIRYLDFPVTVPIAAQTLGSGFALKIHALLCRDYAKGRDWWDFVWYIRRRVVPDFALLASALDQIGPWAGSRPEVTGPWLLGVLRDRVAAIDWSLARQDVARFIPASGQASLAAWSAEFFRFQIDRLAEYIP